MALEARSDVERSAVSLGPTALAARDRLLADIAAGRPGPGERLGAERELAERLGVSRSTIRAALADLERSGVVRRLRGRAGGIFVAERKVERDLTSLAGLPAYLRRQGFESDARVLSTATVEADAETAAALGLAAAALVLEVVRVRLADGEPISLERALFPAERFPDLLDRSLGGSLYELLETQYAVVPGEAEERIEVVAAGTAEARLLELRRGAPLLAVARTAWDADGRAFERSHDLFRADRARIVVRLPSAAARWLNLESRRTTCPRGTAKEGEGEHGHHQAGPRGRGPPRGHRRVGLRRRLGRRSPEAERDRAVGSDLRRGHGRGADLGDAVQRPVRHGLRHRPLHPGRVPVRDDHPHDLLDRLRRDGEEDPRHRRLLHVHLARPRA